VATRLSDYHLAGYAEADLVKLDVLVAGEPVDALALVCHASSPTSGGRDLRRASPKTDSAPECSSPDPSRHRSRVIARETVAAIRKELIAKCYGGDISRKRKLLEKQKEGKKRMKRVGRVDISAGSISRRAESRQLIRRVVKLSAFLLEKPLPTSSYLFRHARKA